MKRPAGLAHRLIYDNKFLLIGSVVFSVFVWLFVTIVLSPEIPKTIHDVPIEIEMKNSVPDSLGLQPFGELNYKVDVEVTGRRYVVGNLKAESNAVKVVAQTQYVDTAGKCRLELKATKVNDSDEFTINSLSVDAVEVLFDYLATKECHVINGFEATNGITEDGFIAGEAILSPQKVTVQGPASEVKCIDRVIARYTLQEPITTADENSFDAELVAVNENNGELHYLTFSDKVKITIPVYQVVETNTSLSFKNVPLKYLDNPLPYSVSPEQIQAGVSANYANDNTLSIATIDFADLKPGENQQEIHINDIKDVKVLKPVINSFDVTVNVDPQKYASVTRRVNKDDIVLTDLPDELEDAVLISEMKDVTVVGPVNSIYSISADDITVTVDMKNATLDEAQTFDATVTLKNSDDCWIYGHYKVIVRKK